MSEPPSHSPAVTLIGLTVGTIALLFPLVLVADIAFPKPNNLTIERIE